MRVENILKCAQQLDILIEIPMPVLLELDRHARMRIEKLHTRAEKDLKELFSLAGVTPPTQTIPTMAQIMDQHKRSVDELVAHWGISATPMPTVPANDLFEQANECSLLFDEKGSHFKDVIIFHSVVERAQNLNGRVTLITDDKRFGDKRSELQNFAQRRNVSIDFWTPDESEAALTQVLDEKTQAEFEQRKVLARTAVVGLFLGIEKTLIESLGPTRRRGRHYFRDPKLTEILDVDVSLPDTDPRLGFDARVSAQVSGSVEAISTVDEVDSIVDKSWGRVPIQIGVAAYGSFDGNSYNLKSMNISYGGPIHPGAMFPQFRAPATG